MISLQPNSVPVSQDFLLDDGKGITPANFHLPEELLAGLADEEPAIGDLLNLTFPTSEDNATELTPELSREITAEISLMHIMPELEEGVTNVGSKLSGCAIEEVREEFLNREKSFFTKVFTAALDMAERQSGPVTLLFDTDYTIVHHDKSLARPAFGLVISELDNILGDRLQVGLLTSRPLGGELDSSLKGEINNPTFTAGIKNKLKPNFVISSGDWERPSGLSMSDFIHGEDTEAQIEAAKDVLDPKVIDALRQGDMSTGDFYDAKLLVLQKLTVDFPNQAFVIIDDFPHADMIKRDSNCVRGVRVNTEILDSYLRPFSKSVPPKDSELPEPLTV